MKIISTFILSLTACLMFGQGAGYICYQEDISIFPLENLNTRSIEFSPAYYQDGLVFVLAREKSNIVDPKTGRAYFDLMYADIGPDGQTSKPVNFSPNIRTQYHEGPCTFSQDGTELYFTRSNVSGGKGINDSKGLVQLKIYRAVKGVEDWEQTTELPFNSDQYSVAHPALSEDGMYLVFASDMPGGFGGMDLYIVNRMSGQWSEPLNLGAVINSKGHEIFPSWHTDGYLFFSSDGHKGKGGLDLFVTFGNEEMNFSGLQHLDSPFNSTRDDLGLIVSQDGKSGFFGSDRKPTKGKDDLYRWTSPYAIFCTPSTQRVDMKQILVTDDGGIPIDHAFVWIIPMSKEGPSLYKEHFTTDLLRRDDDDSAFYLRWGVTDTLSTETADAISDQQGMVTLNSDSKKTYILVGQHDGYQPYVNVIPGNQVPTQISLKKIQEASAPCINTRFTVYNATGDVVLNGAKIEMTGPCLKIPLSAYSDDDGSKSFCLPKGCVLKATFMQEGYAPHAFTFTPDDADEHWKIYLKSSEALTAAPAPIVSGTLLVLDNIYYDFNKSEIRKGDAEELIALANILNQYEDLTIEMTSHTDTRGSAEYNMELSKRRSESSKAYLVLLGINASRIITKAAGESSPRNHCLDGVPCTEAEHQYNRRTEVRITNPAQGMEIRYKAEG